MLVDVDKLALVTVDVLALVDADVLALVLATTDADVLAIVDVLALTDSRCLYTSSALFALLTVLNCAKNFAYASRSLMPFSASEINAYSLAAVLAAWLSAVDADVLALVLNDALSTADVLALSDWLVLLHQLLPVIRVMTQTYM